MNLCIDIGNTNIKATIFKGDRIFWKRTIEKSEIPRIQSIFSKCGVTLINKAIICSTVPHMSHKIAHAVKKKFKVKPLLIGKEIQLVINSNYKPLKKLGSDRLVNLVGAACLYRAPLAIVSFGTAITIDVLSKSYQHLGGVILPGFKLSVEALSSKTAVLPYIHLKKSPKLLGTDTRSCLNSGILNGTALAIEGILGKISKQTNTRLQVIAVGGDVSLVKGLCRDFDVIDPNHTVKSLNLILKSFS